MKRDSRRQAFGVRDDPALAPFRGLVEALGGETPEPFAGEDPLAGADALVRELQALPALSVPQDFTSRVMAALRGKRRFSLTRSARRWWRFAAAVMRPISRKQLPMGFSQ